MAEETQLAMTEPRSAKHDAAAPKRPLIRLLDLIPLGPPSKDQVKSTTPKKIHTEPFSPASVCPFAVVGGSGKPKESKAEREKRAPPNSTPGMSAKPATLEGHRKKRLDLVPRVQFQMIPFRSTEKKSAMECSAPTSSSHLAVEQVASHKPTKSMARHDRPMPLSANVSVVPGTSGPKGSSPSTSHATYGSSVTIIPDSVPAYLLNAFEQEKIAFELEKIKNLRMAPGPHFRADELKTRIHQLTKRQESGSFALPPPHVDTSICWRNIRPIVLLDPSEYGEEPVEDPSAVSFREESVAVGYPPTRLKKCDESLVPHPMNLAEFERISRWAFSDQVEYLVRLCRNLCNQCPPVDVYNRSGEVSSAYRAIACSESSRDITCPNGAMFLSMWGGW